MKERGVNLWPTSHQQSNNDEHNSPSIWSKFQSPKVDFGQYMTHTRFKEFKRFYPLVWESHQAKMEGDPWWRIVNAVTHFNENMNTVVRTSNDICVDEIISGFRPRTTADGGMPHLTKNPGKPKRIGFEAKVRHCNILAHTS